MFTVTVAGAHGHTVTLNYDSAANAALAQQLADAITAGVHNGTILPAIDTDGPPPTVPSGKTGEWVQSKDGFTILPHGYEAVVNTAHDAIIFGSGDAGESILSSKDNLNFFATGGSGTVAAGGGNNRIVIPGNDPGNWSINTGNGDDVILAMGAGNDTINAGGGRNAITLGDGNDIVTTTGDDTVVAGSGHETIGAVGRHASDVVYGNGSTLYFITTDGAATVYGGTGTDTFFGGNGPDLVYGGSGGNNFLMAGMGTATLFGGGSGDQLYAMGGEGQALHAGAGNETLSGAFSWGADTFHGSGGATSIIGGSGHDTFVFTDGEAGGSATIQGFSHGSDVVDLQDYGKNAVSDALKSQHKEGGNDTITLADHTMITFIGVSNLTKSDFITSGDDGDHGHGGGGDHGHGGGGDDGHGGGGCDDGRDHGHGNNGHGGHDHDDGHGHLRDTLFDHH
jgi:Ca2+-binding RTX toxin-like protein